MRDNAPHISGKDHYAFGKQYSIEERIKLSCIHQGISRDEWIKFAKEQKYCSKFNELCKESNREKYDRECFICGKPESENITKSDKIKKLSVHHVDMNKNQGCDSLWSLIPLCMSCHGIVHNDLWENRIKYLLEMEI